ncbi:RES domain-containing protein [Roseovarius sp. THAF27]|uniref:RES domain-containing protein n=1 Tax=Roseovarius sp. THAF27 TaxID=2587850 RepID=UPI0034A40CC6
MRRKVRILVERLTRGDLRRLVYRAHDPKWAFDPASGAGAAIYGGRYNPPSRLAL